VTVQTKDLHTLVKEIIEQTKVTDIHTHLFAPEFGDLLLSGIDELLTYHYLIAETMRVTNLSYREYWDLSKEEQANLIWNELFINHTPYSEACRGIVTVINKLGLDLKSRDLESYRKHVATICVNDYVDQMFDLANVSSVVMTNDPFDKEERKVWLNGYKGDSRFHAALRIDPLLNDYSNVYRDLQSWGFEVNEQLDNQSIIELQRFVTEWANRMNALYVAVSLPDRFVFPDDSPRTRLIEDVVLPVCRQMNLPFAMMIGVKRGVNANLKSAGDSVGKADIKSVETLCLTFPKNKFMVTMLSKENQYELTVTARKFRNLMVFGCWWFLNTPTLVDEITSMRFELLGTSVIPQHSDARILDQLVYKWDHSRQIISKVLTRQYERLIESGWDLQEDEIKRDVKQLLNDNFWDFIKLNLV
jgi:hypothetical protein